MENIMIYKLNCKYKNKLMNWMTINNKEMIYIKMNNYNRLSYKKNSNKNNIMN